MGAIVSTVNTIFGTKSRLILMVGHSKSGKTTILYKLKLGNVVPTIPTIGSNTEIIEYKDISFVVHDVGGSGIQFTKHYCDLFLKDTDAVILVIDSNDTTLTHYEIRSLLDHFSESTLLILANKQDLPNSRTTAEISQILELDRLPNKRWHIQGTSAAEGTGLNEALDWLSKELYALYS